MSIALTKSGDCALLEFQSEKANSFSKQMLEELAQAISELGTEVKVLVLQSAGEKTFSAGASFEEFQKISSKQEAIQYFSGFMKVLEAIRVCSCPVICRVQGKAVGGAVGLIAACDYVFAHDSASLKLSELELGIGPFTISLALERKLGVAKFSEMLLDGAWKSSSWAQNAGLFNQVFSTLGELDRELNVFSQKLCQQSKKTLSENRKLLWSGTENWPALMQQRVAIVADLLLNSRK